MQFMKGLIINKHFYDGKNLFFEFHGQNKNMRFFVSGKFGAEKKAKEAMRALQNVGHEITLDWTKFGDLRPYDRNSSTSREAAIAEAKGIREADVLVIMADSEGVGMYIELGIAIGLEIPIRVIPDIESYTIFFHHPLVKRVKNIEEVIKEFS
jgi:nucleoside 2-deoxyribosyltransferase